jgi:FlaA1/EpsC-like NDP-sugar epimerase
MFIRLIFNLLQHFQKKKSKNKKAILIYGIKASNISIASSINTNEYSPYYVAGFVSNTQKSNNQTVINLPVYVFTYFYKNTQQFRNIKAILIDKEDMELTEYYMLSECCICNDISILLMPTPVEWQEISKENGNCINAEALLMRSSIHIKNEKIAQEMDGKRLLITGAAGSIGSEIARQVCMFNLTHLILLDIAESPLHDLSIELKEKYPDKNILIVISDTRNFKKMEHVFLLYSPQYIFHAAAYKHVPLMEMQPEEAIMTNVLGTKNVADLAVSYKAERFVMVSTDKAVNPSNVMGASKRIAEIYTQILSAQLNSQASGKDAVTSFIITRFGNVLGSNGSVIPLFLKQIRTGGPVTVTHPDIIRYFMTIPEACNLVLEAGNFGKNGEIYVFDMGKSVKIKNLAEEVIRLSGYEPYRDIDIVYTGLRPGEKLYEELLHNNEVQKSEINEKIMIGKIQTFDPHQTLPLIDELIRCSRMIDRKGLVKKMKEIVPEFISNNSIYCELDKIVTGEKITSVTTTDHCCQKVL